MVSGNVVVLQENKCTSPVIEHHDKWNSCFFFFHCPVCLTIKRYEKTPANLEHALLLLDQFGLVTGTLYHFLSRSLSIPKKDCAHYMLVIIISSHLGHTYGFDNHPIPMVLKPWQRLPCLLVASSFVCPHVLILLDMRQLVVAWL
jgi:hypothetical protein